jgi:pentapeptide MXKDX repeat protein
VRNLLTACAGTAAEATSEVSVSHRSETSSPPAHPIFRPAGTNLPDYRTHSTENIMKRVFGSLALACILTASMSAFAQDSMKQDTSQQDTMKKDNSNDSMKNDSMKKDDSKKTNKKAKTKKDNMKNNNMKDDNMKHDDNMKNDQTKPN